jgi:rsbT co-antagonist protein RsbR
MPSEASNVIAEVLDKQEGELLSLWMKEQMGAVTLRKDLLTEGELEEQSAAFLKTMRAALQQGNGHDIRDPAWTLVREQLTQLSTKRARLGFSPSETATFIFSLKQPLFQRLQKTLEGRPEKMVQEVWQTTVLLDKLGLFTTEASQKAREEAIGRQQEEIIELSTPVVELWEGVLALPLIGTLDSRRSQMVMENLLQRIVETGAEMAIIDITGVPAVDTLTAQHLLKTITATRLMGADCIISGIRPQIAQTIVHLGVDLGGVLTRSSLADALALALKRLGVSISRDKIATQGTLTSQPAATAEG